MSGRNSLPAGLLSCILLCALLSLSCQKEDHFLTDKAYRNTVEKTLSARLAKNNASLKPFFEVDKTEMAIKDNGCYVNNCSITLPEYEALEFLYAYMPLADVTDYPTSYFLQNIRSSFETKKEMSWGEKIPEMVFRHFVLPVRVNNEDLDTARVVFAKELKPRIKDLDMKSAILEVNHWCHEKVTYQPSDGRTSSPLASLRTSFGRCGEESTFTVAALRSVGIPARQVYTPRWAHTDDNHAWVEAWADGQWYFLGACEPEAVLNLGWFNAPASRGMLMHTKVFGHYEGPEEVMLEGPNFTEINLIDNYASTEKANIRVIDENGAPVDSARVYFMIYNYAEFYPAVSKYTDSNGETFLTAGKGDMLAWALKDGKYGYSKVTFREGENVTITLSGSHSFEPQAIDIVPPPENVTLPEVTPEMRARNNRRTAQEDSIRRAYMATFPDKGSARKLAGELGLESDKRTEQLFTMSLGNHKTIEAFLRSHPDKRALDLLASLSQKDLRDVKMENLADSYDNTSSILCPRVALEFLTPYKTYFLSALPEQLKTTLSDPASLISWTKENIVVDTDPKAWNIPQSPKGVYESRLASSSSRDVFFVSLARTLGIDARVDFVTSKVQYRPTPGKGEWVDVNFDSSARSAASPKGKIRLSYTPTPVVESPRYYSHFSISKIVDGLPHLLEFNEGEVDMGGGVSWQTVFKDGVALDTGTYIITSGNRLSDGSVPVTAQLFEIKEGRTTDVAITIRENANAVSVLGEFDSEMKYLPADKKTVSAGPAPGALASDKVSILSKTGRGFYVLGVLEVGKEPTNHTLRDLSAAREKLEKWGRPIVLLCGSKEELERLDGEIQAGRYGTLPSTVIFGVDSDNSIRDAIHSNMKLTRPDLPLFILGDTFNKLYFFSQGYTIGIGDSLSGVVSKLNK